MTSMYVGIYPVMGGEELGTMTVNLPEAMIDALGYEDIGTAAGYIGSSVYNLFAPVLLWVSQRSR